MKIPCGGFNLNEADFVIKDVNGQPELGLGDGVALPPVDASDDGALLGVSNGQWGVVYIPEAEEASF